MTGLAMVMALTPWVSAPASDAAAPSLPPPPDSTLNPELDEILVSGARKTRDPVAVLEWLRRLLGQYSYEGYVELRSPGAPQGRLPVRGSGECTGFGPGPGVQCAMRVTWPRVRGADGAEVPGGVSSLVPAMTLYGFDADFIAIRFQQVDNKGLANPGRGYLTGDVLTTREPCVDVLEHCERITRINAHPDGSVIQTQVDIEQDSVLVVRYVFVQNRIAGPEHAASGEGP